MLIMARSGAIVLLVSCALGMAALLAGACGADDACAGADCGAAGGGQGGEGTTTIQDACPDSGVVHGPFALRFNETSAVVRWDACAETSGEITVEPEAGGTPQTVTGTRTAWNVMTSYDLINGVSPDLPGLYYLNEVEITGLTPSSCYRYTLAADQALTGRFCTARSAGDSFKFLAIGDTNPAIGDTEGVLEHVLEQDLDFAIHLGDIQYYQSIFDSWSNWFSEMQPMLAQGAFMPSVGNHEYENDYEFQDYYERLFGGAGFDGIVEYYRYQSGGVWFFSLSTEMDLSAGSAQANWLEAQLADAAAQPGYRFGVVYFHRPMITLSEYSQLKSEREHFTPIFNQYGVRLVMQGHIHGYERFVDGDITYIISGGGGAALHDLDASIDERPEEALLRQASASRYHGTIIEVGETSINGRAIANDGALLDSFTITLP